MCGCYVCTNLAGNAVARMHLSLPLSARLAHPATPDFYMGTRNLNSDPLALLGRALLTLGAPSTSYLVGFKKKQIFSVFSGGLFSSH